MVKRNDPEIITHCDAVQGFLKIPFKPRTLCADLVSVSGHKVHALKGVGALYIRHGVRVKPILCGSEQERGLRPGTESVPLIASFGAATEKLSLNIEERLERVSQLRSSLIAQLREMDGVIVRDIEGASPYVLNISLLGYRSEIVLHYLEQREVYVSSGSACSKGSQQRRYWNYSGQSPQRWTVPCESASVQRTQRRILQHWYRDCGTHRKN